MKNFPFIQKLHEETRKPMGVPADENEWPDSWKKVEFKEYPRFPKIILPPPKLLAESFGNTLKNRRSRRHFDPQKTLSSEELSTLLFWSAGLSENKDHPEDSLRFYPSGGARFPLEIYSYFRGNEKIPEGIYHYNIKQHLLESLIDTPDVKEYMAPIFPLTYPFAKDAAVFIFITAVWDRAMRKYKERGYRFALLEAGALIQNFYLASTALDLGCCALGSVIDDAVEEVLDLERGEENFITALAAGSLK